MLDYNRIQTHVNIGDIFINIWDHIDSEDSTTYQTTFWTRELNGGEPGRIQLGLKYIP